MAATLGRLQQALGRLLFSPERAELHVGPAGLSGDILVPSEGDGRHHIVDARGQACLTPDDSSYYLYCVLPPALLARAHQGLWIEVEYWGSRYGEFRLQYASRDRAAAHEGLYASAEQRWDGQLAGIERRRRALFRLADLDVERRQNHEASFRFEFRSDLRLTRIVAFLEEPADAASYTQTAPVPELRKLPGRFYPINYLFIEITNACNFKCTWCPDEIMDRKRGFMKKQKVFRLLDEIAQKRAFLGPLYPVKLHQMGEPMLHPDLSAIVERAESQSVPIELNTNCGLITEERIDGLYKAGLTNLVLSYQTPDLESFKTRKAPRIAFDEYRDKVRLAVERKVALGARTNLEIDIMNTKHAEGVRIVSEDQQALDFLTDWIEFCQELERRYGLTPRVHDWERIRSSHFLDADENGSRYELLPGVTLIWKRVHSWGNVIGDHTKNEIKDTYCPAPYDQFVIHWNGDVVSCCTDYEGHTKTANVFGESIEAVWRGDILKRRKQDMLAGRLLDVCARCQGVK